MQVITQTASPLYQLESFDVRFNPPRDIAFNFMINSQAGMLALALAAAYDLARLTMGRMTVEAMELESKSIRRLSERISKPETCADDTSIFLVLVFIHADCEMLFEVGFL